LLLGLAERLHSVIVIARVSDCLRSAAAEAMTASRPAIARNDHSTFLTFHSHIFRLTLPMAAPMEKYSLEVAMFTRRNVLASAAGAAFAPFAFGRPARAADKPSEIRIDWATYNPVSMVLKDKGLLEKEFGKDGIGIRWVQTLGSNKALEFLNAGSIDFGSTAGSAALLSKINGNPIKSIYVYSQPEWTALVTRKDMPINKIEDLKGKRVAVTRGTDPHIFLVRALLSVGLSEKDISEVLLQHPDGKTALIRGDVDAWAGLDPMMAQAQVEDGARLFYRNKDANTYGILNAREEFLKAYPDLTRRVLATYENARKYCLANYDDEKRVFIEATKLPGAVVDIQLKERTDLTFNRIGAPQRDTILKAGLALQQAGVIPGNVDVKKTLDDLVDDRFVSA
jgi:sulfonate transport system substrate-binding protein